MWTDLPDFLKTELEREENADIFLELNDSKYLSRQHYSRATYALGCHGPLCRRAERDRGRRRTQQKAESKGREYQPNPEIQKNDREGLMQFIISWHLTHPGEIQRRAEARSA